MSNPPSQQAIPVLSPPPMEEYMGERSPLMGGGKGGAKLDITKGIPLQDDDNFCRQRCCCVDSGCTKFRLKCQFLFLKSNEGLTKIDVEKRLPFLEEENFCRTYFCCVDGGCRKFDLKIQWFCIKFEL